MRRAIVLFTCDLRVRDNAALAAAASAGFDEVTPLFVLDDELLGGSCGSPNRVAFLLDSLRDLDASLRERGAGLVLRRGDVIEETMRLAERHRAEAIHIAADATPYSATRRERLRRACERSRIALHEHEGPSVVTPGAIVPTGGGHYRVFTPYWRVWRSQPLPAAAPTPRRLKPTGRIPALRLPRIASLTAGTPSPELATGGETVARERLTRWLGDGVATYGDRHDDLAEERTSRLSPYLHFGCVSPRTVLERAQHRPDAAEDFMRQLCWRDFHRQVLADRPDLPHGDYRPRGDRWRRSRRDLEAWREGLTGYPIVDAGMRQLEREGFMHNRARLIVASFLTKTLYLDWRRGAAHFARLLQDADVANNVGNWQWVAGTGNDTRPNRVLNPLRQAQRFDPDGEYVRRYVPELAGVGGRAVHEPWRLQRRPSYPARIVDHERAAAELRARRER